MQEKCKIFIGHTDLTDPTDFWSADKHDYFFIFTDHRTQASCRAQQSWHYSISHRSNGSHWFFCAGAALAASICEIKNNLWKENPWDLWDLCDIIINNFMELDVTWFAWGKALQGSEKCRTFALTIWDVSAIAGLRLSISREGPGSAFALHRNC